MKRGQELPVLPRGAGLIGEPIPHYRWPILPDPYNRRVGSACSTTTGLGKKVLRAPTPADKGHLRPFRQALPLSAGGEEVETRAALDRIFAELLDDQVVAVG